MFLNLFFNSFNKYWVILIVRQEGRYSGYKSEHNMIYGSYSNRAYILLNTCEKAGNQQINEMITNCGSALMEANTSIGGVGREGTASWSFFFFFLTHTHCILFLREINRLTPSIVHGWPQQKQQWLPAGLMVLNYLYF